MKDGSAVITTSNQGRIEFDCPENASKAAFRSAIRRDLLWYNDVRIKAYNNGLTVDQMLDKEAEWLVQNQ